MNISKSKVLIGRKQILSYLKITKYMLYDLIKEGLPVKKRAGRLTGNTDEIDSWFRVNKDE